ncbi:MAG TPA: MFS transporter [Caulobacteraceae bacterium]|nr:MFS transporter [Caulobacteraceae bacterium]
MSPGLAAESDIGARLDRLPASPYLWWLVALLSFGAFFEIYDVFLSAPLSLGLLAAGVFHAGAAGLFGLSDQATFVAATFAGLWLGTVGFSAIADRLGRRPVFTLALVWYAAATMVMGLQSTPLSIDAWRFVASVGVGVELVAIDCYLAELMPRRIRGRAFAVSASIQFLSAPLVAILAWGLIPGNHFGIAGWRWLAFVPGVGAVLVWWVRRALPESPRWLAAHGRPEEADRVMTLIETRAGAGARASSPLVASPVVPVAFRDAGWKPALRENVSQWRPPYRKRTIVLIVFHLFQTVGYYGFANWLPTLLVSQGVTIGGSLAYAAVIALVPTLAPLVFTAVADRAERKWLIIGGALTAAVFGLMMSGMTGRSNFLVFTLIGAVTAAGLSLMSFAYHAYQSEIFPTAIRARAVGLVYSFSRLSAVFSGYLIAAALGRFGGAGAFALISAAMIVVALTIGLFGPRTRGLALEGI